jgi:hypothetical protein
VGKDGATGRQSCGGLAGLLRERILLFALVFATLIFLVGMRRTVGETGAIEEKAELSRLWRQKITWRACADVVIAGDSRIYRGVSPAAMHVALDETRILNFGFSGAGYSAEYIEATEQVLDPAGRGRRIVLGITPYSLTRSACRSNGFVAELLRPGDVREEFEQFLVGFGGRWTQPMPLNWSAVAAELRFIEKPRTKQRKQKERYISEPHDDGWVASTKDPETPNYYVEPMTRLLQSNPTDGGVLSELLRAVSRWRRGGILVYAFRPPTTTEMVTAENDAGGFNEEAFVAAFEAAGGRWLNMDQTAYHSYDGSHLTRDAAERLSRDLAKAIRGAEAGELAAERPPAP